MPRPRNPQNENARHRTESWRNERHRRGRPEASIIDRAIAASVAAFFNAGPDAYDRPADIDMIVLGAERILLSKGFDRFEVRAELGRRLTRRSDLAHIEQVAGVFKQTAA
jgi:hypothetical protein